MALFKRADLKSKGMTDEQIEFVMTESGRALSDYELKTAVQSKIDEAVKAVQPAEINVLESSEYLSLMAENEKLKALGTDDFSVVKAPYKDMVWDKLDHGAEHKPYNEQLTALAETMPDLFATQQEEPKQTPQFAGGTAGTMPQGNEAPSFGKLWGFAPNK
jgi:hypothetical protein